MVNKDLLQKKQALHKIEFSLESCLDYLDEWMQHVQFIKQFDWISLDKPIEWKKIENTAKTLMEKGVFPTEMHQQLCKNYGVLNANINTAQIDEFNQKKLSIGERWVQFFKKCAEESYDCRPLALIVSYILAIPGNIIYFITTIV